MEKADRIDNATKDWGEERGICPHCDIEFVPLDEAGMPVYCIRCEEAFNAKTNHPNDHGDA